MAAADVPPPPPQPRLRALPPVHGPAANTWPRFPHLLLAPHALQRIGDFMHHVDASASQVAKLTSHNFHCGGRQW